MANEGVLATDVAGVRGATSSTADSASLWLDSLRNILGRLAEVLCALGVRVCLEPPPPVLLL